MKSTNETNATINTALTTAADSKHSNKEDARAQWKHCIEATGYNYRARKELFDLVVSDSHSYMSADDYLAYSGYETWMTAYKDSSDAVQTVESIFNLACEEKPYYVHKKTGISIPLEEYQVYDYVKDALDRELDERIVALMQNPQNAYDLFGTYDGLVIERVSKLNAEKVLDCGSFVLIRSTTNPVHDTLDSRKRVNWTDVLDSLSANDVETSTWIA